MATTTTVHAEWQITTDTDSAHAMLRIGYPHLDHTTHTWGYRFTPDPAHTVPAHTAPLPDLAYALAATWRADGTDDFTIGYRIHALFGDDHEAETAAFGALTDALTPHRRDNPVTIEGTLAWLTAQR